MLCYLNIHLEILPQKWITRLSQQEALLELRVWLEAAGSRLQECRSRLGHGSSSTAALGQLLTDCKVRRTKRKNRNLYLLAADGSFCQGVGGVSPLSLNGHT